MSKYIDLHTHSTASDGSFTPRELVRYAKEKGLFAVALTDHDTIDGVSEAADEAKKINMEFISGIELNCKFDRELHIVGLYIDIKNKILNQALSDIKKVREKRNVYTLEKLSGIGINITMEDVFKQSAGNIFGRAHVAKAMVEKGYVQNTKEAFKKYLGHGRVGFCATDRIEPEEAIKLIKDSGGYAILAHCHYLGMEEEEFVPFVKGLKEQGLDGLEGYYTEYTKKQEENFIRIAKELELKISGGSDFHGSMKPQIEIGSGFGNLKVSYDLLSQFKE